jgi:hypothetical protein
MKLPLRSAGTFWTLRTALEWGSYRSAACLAASAVHLQRLNDHNMGSMVDDILQSQQNALANSIWGL